MAGVENDQPHAVEHPGMDPVDDVVAHFGMRLVAPPGKNFGLGQHRLGQAVLRLIQGRGLHRELTIRPKPGGDRPVDPIGIHLTVLLLFLLVPVLIPHGYSGSLGSRGHALSPG